MLTCLHAGVRRVVGPFTLLTVVVADAVGVLLRKLLRIGFGGEGVAPEFERLVQRQSDALKETKGHIKSAQLHGSRAKISAYLQKQAVLHTTPMPQMLVRSERLV